MRYASMVYRDYISTTEIILDILQTMIKNVFYFNFFQQVNKL